MKTKVICGRSPAMREGKTRTGHDLSRVALLELTPAPGRGLRATLLAAIPEDNCNRTLYVWGVGPELDGLYFLGMLMFDRKSLWTEPGDIPVIAARN
jgi:hypothetical protein